MLARCVGSVVQSRDTACPRPSSRTVSCSRQISRDWNVRESACVHVAAAMAAAASNTEGHGPTANASGCDRTKAPRPTRANVAAVLPPWRRLQVWTHQRPPAARTTPPRVREPVLDATAYPTISVPLATGAVGVDDMLGSVAL